MACIKSSWFILSWICISEDIKKWGRKVKWLIKDFENSVRELADYPGKRKMRSFKRKQHS